MADSSDVAKALNRVTNLERADLSGADLSRANLRGTNLEREPT